jgi:hypothetical protein
MAGSNTRDLVSGLSKPRRGKQTSIKKQARGAIVPKAGKGTFTAEAEAAASGGIDSPLTEKPGGVDEQGEPLEFGSREYYPIARYIRDSTTFYVFEYYNLKKMYFTDAKNREIVFVFADVPIQELHDDTDQNSPPL